MKACTRYLDYVEQEDYSSDSPEWQDLLAHAGRCPECSFAMKQRAEMLEALGEMKHVSYPRELHQSIMAEINASPQEESQGLERFENFLQSVLRPAQIGLSLACVMMISLMMTSDNESIRMKPAEKSPTLQLAAADIEKPAVVDKNQLQPVTKEEVKEFLARLDEFNRRHQNVRHDQPGEKVYLPELKLVNDWNQGD